MNNSYYAKQINDIVSEVKKAVIGKDSIIIKTLLAIPVSYTHLTLPTN